jgi:hypothetical protein
MGVRELGRRLSRFLQDWPRWAQVAGILLGSWQIIEWRLTGREPSVGIMGFAGALLMFQRAAAAQRKRNGNGNGNGGNVHA